jgi:hypothetical protein
VQGPVINPQYSTQIKKIQRDKYIEIVKVLILPFAGKWMELENIMLSEVSQIQTDKSCIFLSYVKDIEVQIQVLLFIYVYVYVFPKVEPLQEEEKNNREWIILKYIASV